MEKHSFNNKKFRITLREIIAVLVFYFFFSLIYHIVIWYNGTGYQQDGLFGWVSLKNYWLSSGMQYLFYFFDSMLIWFLAIYLLRHKSMTIQIGIVALLIPVSVFFIRESRYIIIDAMKMGRLRGTGTVWDWYIPSLFLLFQFGCFFAYRYFLENQWKLKIEGELRQAALESELSAIKAQLNPHFLYNVFNTINASLPPGNEGTRNMIAQLSDLFRYQLQATKHNLVTLREELEFVTKYLELEKARFEDRLIVLINVSEEFLDEKVPPMILQPLVENSVKHGLSSMIDGGTINITVFKSGEKLKFEITDTGIGVADKISIFKSGVGLSNTHLRLQKMYNSKLEIFDNEPRGLKVSFVI